MTASAENRRRATWPPPDFTPNEILPDDPRGALLRRQAEERRKAGEHLERDLTRIIQAQQSRNASREFP